MSLTENDRKLIVLGFQCFESQPKVDFTKLAQLGGYKTAESAGVMYRNAKKKLLSITPTDPNTTIITPTTTPTTTPTKKRAAPTPKLNADGTPAAKRVRGTPKKAAAKKDKKAGKDDGNGGGKEDGDDEDGQAAVTEQLKLEDAHVGEGGLNGEGEGDEHEDVFARYTNEADEAEDE